ncbi:MAG: hypothetical protein M5U28_02545 [Sandaracinaceae bacterium]|nr:hypothetical protein [Sandaracinaceae bacterium]
MICGRTEAGAVLCWPALGGSATAVAGVTDAVDVAVGEAHACARRRGGQVLCWGQNNRGQLGETGRSLPARPPVTVVGITDAIELDLGGTHSCVRAAPPGACRAGAATWKVSSGRDPPQSPRPDARRVERRPAWRHGRGEPHVRARAQRRGVVLGERFLRSAR